MGSVFKPLPLDVFNEEARPHIARLNRDLTDLFRLHGALEMSVDDGGAPDRTRNVLVHTTRITPDLTEVLSGQSTVVGVPALTFGLTNVQGTTTTAISVNSSVRFPMSTNTIWGRSNADVTALSALDVISVLGITNAVLGPVTSGLSSVPIFSDTSGNISDPNRLFVIGNSLVFGVGAAGVDYEIRFDGETNDASLVWLEDEKVLNLRTDGEAYFDVSGLESALTINTSGVGGGGERSALAAWSRPLDPASSYYGFYGGVYDTGASAVSSASIVGAQGFNTFAGTNTRTIQTAYGGYFTTNYGGSNLTVTNAVGVRTGAFDGSAPTGGNNYTGIEIIEPGGSCAINRGILIPPMTSGTVDFGIESQALIKLATTNRIGFGGALGLAHLHSLRSGGAAILIVEVASADVCRFTSTAFHPSTNGAIGLGQNANGFGDLWLKDTSAAFEVRSLFTSSPALTADRVLTIGMSNADRTVTLMGSPTLADWFDQSVKTTADPRFNTILLNDSDDSHQLTVAVTSNLTAARQLSLATGDAARTITLTGNPTLGDWFDQDYRSTAEPQFVQVQLEGTGGNLIFGVTTGTGGDTTIFFGNDGSNYTLTMNGHAALNQNVLTTSGPTFAGMTFSDGGNVVLNATTGSKIATATTQKLGLWNATPVVQPSSTGEGTGHTTVGGVAVLASDTFTGNSGTKAYTINDIVKHLKTVGILAAS